MKRNFAVKVLGAMMAIVVVGMLPASIARAEYKIHEEGICLDLVTPEGAKSMTNSLGEIFVYNETGDVITKQTSSGYLVDYAYDQAGHKTMVIEHKYAGEPWGAITTLYDALGRPAYEVDAFGAILADYTYDKNVVVKTSRDFPYDTWTYIYDDLGRMIQYNIGTEQTYTYTYDALGNIIQLVEKNIYGSEVIVDITYDAHNNIQTVHKHGNEGTEESYIYTNVYDALGRLVYSSNGVDYECSFTY